MSNTVRTIEFLGPDGENYSDPGTLWLMEMILRKGETYWVNQNDQGVLTCYENGQRKRQLILTYAKDHGFQVEFWDSETGFEVSLGEGNFEESVAVNVGGDDWILPTRFFVTKEQACMAAEHFYHTCGKTGQITWGNRSEQNWHYGYPKE